MKPWMWLLGGLLPLGCRDLGSFSTRGDHFEGTIVRARFVRAGFPEDVKACLTLDMEHLADSPGTLSTSDGTFRSARLRSIPELQHDPLSELSFGQGRERNLLFAASPVLNAGPDVTLVVSLMQEGGVEVRIWRGAPGGVDGQLFGLFPMARGSGPCAY